mgnify:CR=1 FL=1
MKRKAITSHFVKNCSFITCKASQRLTNPVRLRLSPLNGLLILQFAHLKGEIQKEFFLKTLV